MSKMFLAVLASLATLVATSTAAKATFTVTFSVNGTPIGGVNAFGLPTIVPPSGGANSSYNATLPSSGLSQNNGVRRTIGTDSIESSSISELRTNSISITNRTGASIANLTITVTQNAYTFPVYPSFFTNASALDVLAGTISGGSFTASATNQATQNYTFGASGGSVGSVVTAVGGSGPYSITQTFVITNLSQLGTIEFTNSASSITTPLPATGLMAAVGLPLLGLAGAFRRRVLG